METLKNLIPPGVLVPFLAIIVFEVLVSNLLTFYGNSLQNQTISLESKIKAKEGEIAKQILAEDSFVAFSQIVNIVEISKNRKSVIPVLEKFNSLMPKFLTLESFNFNEEAQEISFQGNIDNTLNYIRFLNYINNHQAFEVKSITPVGIPKVEGKINFSATIKLKPSFYQ
jgi:hypothetical protein